MVIFVMSHEQNWRPLFHDLAKRNRSAIARLVEEPRLFHSLNVGAARHATRAAKRQPSVACPCRVTGYPSCENLPQRTLLLAS